MRTLKSVWDQHAAGTSIAIMNEKQAEAMKLAFHAGVVATIHSLLTGPDAQSASDQETSQVILEWLEEAKTVLRSRSAKSAIHLPPGALQ